jgi:hypothetical protein
MKDQLLLLIWWLAQSGDYRWRLRRIGEHQTFEDKRQALMRLVATPVPLFSCPSRSSGRLLPQNEDLPFRNVEYVRRVAKTDYAINEGDYVTDTQGGPESYRPSDLADYDWRWPEVSRATGIAFQQSQVRAADVRDGLSKTYLAGEKHVSLPGRETADDPSHDQAMYCGVDLDINRWVIEPPAQDGYMTQPRRFGSAHPDGCHMVLCDGAVRVIAFDIDPEVHRRLGNRRDGLAVQVP